MTPGGRRCPACDSVLASRHTLIEYRLADGRRREFAECPSCGRVDHPRTGAHRVDDGPGTPARHSRPVLRSAVEDEETPRSVTVFDPEQDPRTHWLAVELDDTCDTAAWR